jgi:hypothetical protein
MIPHLNVDEDTEAGTEGKHKRGGHSSGMKRLCPPPQAYICNLGGKVPLVTIGLQLSREDIARLVSKTGSTEIALANKLTYTGEEGKFNFYLVLFY